MKLTYETAGVSTTTADTILDTFSAFLKTRPRDKNLLSGIGGYASAYSLKPLLNGMQDPLLITCCDGVGTKVKLALDWNAIDSLGEDLVAMNVNDLLCAGALPSVFLDYYASAKLDGSQLLPLLKSIQKGCELAECALAGGETAEMPGLYQSKDFDLAGFCVGIADRSQLLGAHRVQVGQELIGIESSGIHSNGYSLIRKLVEKENLTPSSKAPFSDKTWSELLLAPTIIYVKALKDILPKFAALAHITGSGLFGNLPRVLKPGQKATVHARTWPKTPLYSWIEEKASLSPEELLETFNGGIGMIGVVDKLAASEITDHLTKHGLKTFRLGEVEQAANSEQEPYVEWKA